MNKLKAFLLSIIVLLITMPIGVFLKYMFFDFNFWGGMFFLGYFLMIFLIPIIDFKL